LSFLYSSPVTSGYWGSSWGVKQPWSGNHPPLSSTEVKNEQSYNYSLPVPK